jgi:hypothetical protein
MPTTSSICAAFVVALALGSPQLAAAQASGQASGNVDIEQGAIRPSPVEMNASHPHARVNDNGTRLGIQVRINALNMLNFTYPDVGGSPVAVGAESLLVPIVTPGVRLIDDKLFLGLGLGLSGTSVSNGPNNSRSGWSLSPLASYDLIADQFAAFYLVGWFNLAHQGETQSCPGNGNVCMITAEDTTGWGLNLGAGVRGMISRGLALGGEFGWGFLDLSVDNGPDIFFHGIFGNLFLEASVGI